MGIKPPARASVLLLEVFRKRAFLNTWPWPLSPALPKCSTTLFNNSNRSTTASRVCWTDGAVSRSLWEVQARSLMALAPRTWSRMELPPLATAGRWKSSKDAGTLHRAPNSGSGSCGKVLPGERGVEYRPFCCCWLKKKCGPQGPPEPSNTPESDSHRLPEKRTSLGSAKSPIKRVH